MVKAGAQRKQAGNASLLSVVKIQRKTFSKKKNNKSSTSNCTHCSGDTPTYQKWEKWASISGSVPCWGSTQEWGTKGSCGQQSAKHTTLTTLVSNLTSLLPRVPCCLLSSNTLVCAECTRPSSELQNWCRVSNKHLPSLSCNASYQPLNQLQVTFTECTFSPQIKAALRSSDTHQRQELDQPTVSDQEWFFK